MGINVIERRMHLMMMQTTQTLTLRILLMDQLDSIHSFLFHSMTRRHFVPFGDIEDNKEDILKKTIDECNVDELIQIFNQRIFDNLKEKIKKKLMNHKSEIIEYFKANKIDGIK